MGVPLDEVDVHEARSCVPGVDLYEHVGVGVVAGGGHGVVLGAEGVAVVDPLVDVAGYYELNVALVLLQEGMQAIVGELHRAILDERVVDEDEGGLVLLELGFEPVELLLAKRADAGIEVG